MAHIQKSYQWLENGRPREGQETQEDQDFWGFLGPGHYCDGQSKN